MYAGREFPPVVDQSARLLGIDLSKILASGETITAVTSHIRTLSGTDALPQNHLPQPPQFSGGLVTQLVVLNDPSGSLIGNAYALSFLATTSAGQVMGPWSRFHVEPGFGVTGYPGGTTPASAQSATLIAGPLFYTLPTLMGGYAGQDFPVANQSEKLAYGFDFSPALSPDEVITSAISDLTLLSGTDAAVMASPTAYASGGPVISGNVVSQLIAWPGGSGLTGNVYALYLTAVTSFNQSLAAWAKIIIDRVA